ncbi:MAG TPA: hypothetical protein VF902_01930, partial [Coriobacteriia bacterium]
KNDWASATIQPCGGGATRTIGYWKNHWAELQHAFTVHLGGRMNLGYVTLTSTKQVYDLLWTEPSTADPTMSYAQARIILARQLAAAILNSTFTNAARLPIDPVTGKNLVTAGRAAAARTNVWEMLRLADLLDRYNNSGVSVRILDACALAGSWGLYQ